MSPRLAVLADFLEEGWPSMDLAAEQLAAHLAPCGFEASLVRPPFARRFSLLGRTGRNADRLLNRFHDYPSRARALASAFDFFHVADHSYASLVRALPAERTGVYCHDLDAFRCVLEPEEERRGPVLRAMARELLRGVGRASVVFTSTETVARELARRGLVASERVVVAPYGVASEYTPAEDPDREPFLLHVGSCIPRKRVDVLLEVFAGVRRPELRLVQVGGEWTAEQRARIARLGIGERVSQERGLTRSALAQLYRRAALVLLTSEREGFGIPVIEALACGAVVVASDLEVVREVGGDAVVRCPVADRGAWIETIERLLDQPGAAPGRELRLARARRFSWAEHAATVAAAYRRLAT